MTRTKLEIRRLRTTEYSSRQGTREKVWILDRCRRIWDFLGKIEQERSGNLVGKYGFSGEMHRPVRKSKTGQRRSPNKWEDEKLNSMRWEKRGHYDSCTSTKPLTEIPPISEDVLSIVNCEAPKFFVER
jgi:hypothetical protein